MQYFHSSLLGGHAGSLRAFMRLASQFFWKGMHSEIHKFVQECIVCQQAKNLTTPPSGLLQSLPIPKQIWEEIAMDFICGLPNSKGFSVIMVVVDQLSKYDHFMLLNRDFSSITVAEVFIHSVLKLHRLPRSIVCDRDKVFTSHFWQHLFSKMGTSIQMSTAYHSQSDGQTEALNKCLETYLRCFTSVHHGNWWISCHGRNNGTIQHTRQAWQ